MDPKVRLALTVLIAALVVGGFGVVFGWGMIATWLATDKPPVFSEPYLYVSTALAGLIGGIVALGFGQPPPNPRSTPRPDRLTRSMAGLGRMVLPGQREDWQRIMASAYAVVYIVWGVAAIVTWVVKSPVTPPLVKNLASVSFGLFLPITQAFLGEQD